MAKKKATRDEPLARLMRALEALDTLDAERKSWLDGWKARHTKAAEQVRALRARIATGQRDLFDDAEAG